MYSRWYERWRGILVQYYYIFLTLHQEIGDYNHTKYGGETYLSPCSQFSILFSGRSLFSFGFASRCRVVPYRASTGSAPFQIHYATNLSGPWISLAVDGPGEPAYSAGRAAAAESTGYGAASTLFTYCNWAVYRTDIVWYSLLDAEINYFNINFVFWLYTFPFTVQIGLFQKKPFVDYSCRQFCDQPAACSGC